VTTDGQLDAATIGLELREAQHSTCFACSAANPVGLALDFRVVRPGQVETVFSCSNLLQSYEGVLHGGIICLLLDAAMTNCGFSMGRVMVTGDLQVRFLHPVPTDASVVVRARADEPSHVLQMVRGEITLDGQVMARAVGKFVDKTERRNLGDRGKL
jgi:uncharacterized protein (TIGR00369 family)